MHLRGNICSLLFPRLIWQETTTPPPHTHTHRRIPERPQISSDTCGLTRCQAEPRRTPLGPLTLSSVFSCVFSVLLSALLSPCCYPCCSRLSNVPLTPRGRRKKREIWAEVTCSVWWRFRDAFKGRSSREGETGECRRGLSGASASGEKMRG